jgi:cytochrome c oxidase assembly protein subunit 15
MTRRFQKLAIATTVTTYLLILVGALVRASGAGMGCPDWPRCFDRWVPPTDLAQVPPHLAPYFNVRLAWTEYLNRLLGVTTGLLIFATLVFALVDYRHVRRVVASSAGAFVGVGLAGWLGKRVVEKNLDPSFVTVHMFVALAVVALLIDATVASFFAPARGEPERTPAEPTTARRQLAMGALAVTGVVLVQIALGTRVRATLERVAQALPALPRADWIGRVGAADSVHRSFALLVLGLTVALARYARRADPHPLLSKLATALAVGSGAQIAAGVGLAYVALPPVLQVVHVTLGSLLLGGLVALVLLAPRLPSAKAAPTADADTPEVASAA